MYDFYRLNSSEHNGLIVRQNTEDGHEDFFNVKTREWQLTSIMLAYVWPESDTFEMYEELTKEEADQLISAQIK